MNYMNDLSLDQLADRMSLHPNYITLFLAYVWRLRI